jgi:hypothetical protein
MPLNYLKIGTKAPIPRIIFKFEESFVSGNYGVTVGTEILAESSSVMSLQSS